MGRPHRRGASERLGAGARSVGVGGSAQREQAADEGWAHHGVGVGGRRHGQVDRNIFQSAMAGKADV